MLSIGPASPSRSSYPGCIAANAGPPPYARSASTASDAGSSVLAVELLPEEQPPPDPLGAQLGQVRILRTSPLVPVGAVCAPCLTP